MAVQVKDLGQKQAPIGAEALERILIGGDLKDLTPAQRVQYYVRCCESLGLNHLSKPFEYITLNGRLTLYAKRDATDQLRNLHGVSVTKLMREKVEDVYVVTATAVDRMGRTDESMGAVSITGLKGENLANALMKAETKAKRRVTLSIVGLGWLDETEVETVPSAQHAAVDDRTGEILAADEPKKVTAPANATPKTAQRAQLERRYRQLMDTADTLMVPCEHFDPRWSDADLTTKGQALKAAIEAKQEAGSAAGQ